MSSDVIGIVLISLFVILVLQPPRWDPAIRIKEWQLKRWRKKP